MLPFSALLKMTCNCGLMNVLGVLLVFAFFHNLANVSGQDIPKAGKIPEVGLFTFGDSHYDAGNRKFITNNFQALPQNFWPYGKSRDNPDGRYCDGKIIPDFIARFIGIPHDIPPALKPGVNVSRGASFAVGHATILGSPKDSLSLNQQIREYNKMISNWSGDYLQKSVFMINVGMDDCFDFIKNHPDADASAQQAFVTSVINRLRTDIGLLYASEASKFVVQMLAPLGCMPIARQEYKTGNNCYEKLNDLAKQLNAKIGPMLNELAKTMTGFQFTVFDFYNVILRRVGSNVRFRYTVANISCCGIGTHNAYGCGLPNVHSKLCEYPRSYLYFDARHNSEKAQESFAHLLFGANPNVVQPMTVRELVVYPVGESMREFWKEPEENNLSLMEDGDVDASESIYFV